MNLKLIVTTLVIAAVPVFAQVEELRAANVKADAQEVVKLISADKAKTQAYCDIAKLGEQMDQAEQRKDGKKTEELAKKLDEMSQTLARCQRMPNAENNLRGWWHDHKITFSCSCVATGRFIRADKRSRSKTGRRCLASVYSSVSE